jgi:hypothetical protein
VYFNQTNYYIFISMKRFIISSTPVLMIVFALFAGGTLSLCAFGQTGQPSGVIQPLLGQGMGGLIIVTGENVVSPQAPVQGVVGFNIYRKASGEVAFTKLNAKPIQRSDDKQAFTRVLGDGYVRDVAQYLKLNEDEAWRRIQSVKTREDIPELMLDPRAMLPFGQAFVDSSAKKGVSYEYHIAPVTASGEGAKVSAGSITLKDPPVLLSYSNFKAKVLDSGAVRLDLRYIMQNGELYGFEILRGAPTGELRTIDVVLRGSGSTNPSTTYVDTTVEYGGAYRYVAVPITQFFDKAVMRDTMRVVAAFVKDLPIAQKFFAESTTAGVRLTWTLQRPPAPEYRGTIILRSVAQKTADSGFVPVDTVGYTTTEYIDRDVKPGDQYVYCSRTLGVDMSVGLLSSNYKAMFEMGFDKTNIPPPINLRGVSTKTGIRLTWSPLKIMPIEGYYVYRAMSARDSMELVGKVLSVGGKDTTFLDSAKHLSAYSPYYYAVATLNGSFVWGAKSERIAVRHDANARPDAPPTPSAYQEYGAVMVQWPNESAMNSALAGYNVYRKQEGKQPEKLTATPLASNVTQFRDLKPPADEMLSYTITSMDAVGKESPPSPAAMVENRLPALRPPSSVRAVPSGKAVTVRWSATTDKRVTGYEIFRASKGSQAVSIGKVAAEVAEFVDKQAKAGEAQYYTVVALAAKERSPKSTEVVVIP